MLIFVAAIYFLNKEGKCSIYELRPAGCRVYPLVYEPEEDDILIDTDCREAEWFANQVYQDEQLQFVRELGKRLIKETKTIKK